MPVRDATTEDLSEILEMVHELATYERDPDAVVLDPDEFARNVFGVDAVAHALIAETPSGEIAGVAIWFPTFSTWLGKSGIWLEDLFVRPDHRRAGLGRDLLDALRARTDGRVEWAVLNGGSVGAAPLDHLAMVHELATYVRRQSGTTDVTDLASVRQQIGYNRCNRF